MVPCQLLFDPGPARPSHRTPPRFVIDQVDQQPCQLIDVVRGCVDRGVGCRDSGLAQVEGDDRQSEGHVLHRLVHRGDIVQRVLGIGRDAHVGGGEDCGHVRIGDPSGERDEVRQVEAVAQRDEIVEAVARSDEGEADVATPESVYDVIRHLQYEVDTILWPHHTQIGSQMGSGSSEARLALRCDEVGSGPDPCGRR